MRFLISGGIERNVFQLLNYRNHRRAKEGSWQRLAGILELSDKMVFVCPLQIT